MTISGGSALSKDDIDKMVKDAEQYAEDDRKKREEVETRNQAESLVHTTEKFVAENGDKIGDDLKAEVEADTAALSEALKGEDIEAIKGAVTKLGESSQKMGTAMYEAAAAAEAANPSTEGAPAEDQGDDDVVEAEIVDEDETDAKGGTANESDDK